MRVESSIKSYTYNFYNNISDLLGSIKDEHVILVIDRNVKNHYKTWFPHTVEEIIFDSNEENKSFETINVLLNSFVAKQVKSTTTIVAVGGGTLQDAVGFCCSIYNRGIKWKFIPTTLLAQADSCIGGKTSINFQNKKNILGTFYPPTEILICTDFLKTLSEEQYYSGLGEIIKFHVLANVDFNKSKPINELIVWSLFYKKIIIEEDEFDKGKRKFLNYGHTFGHALESTSEYQIPHGLAVLIGILIANRYAFNLDFISESKEKKIREQIYPYIKDLYYENSWFNYEKLINIIKFDKKNTSSINMILLKEDSPFLHQLQDFLTLEKSLNDIKTGLLSISG